MNGTCGRRIIHVDLDAFFASVEQRDDPSLKGRPVVVGGDAARGVVAAASYEARVFGIRSAMPMSAARERCRDLVVVRPRFDAYRAASRIIHGVFAEHTDLIEPLSLDEAYLDVTQNLKGLATATEVAQDIRATILERTGLTASAGVSYNKFLAKMGSGHRKPDGLTVIRPERGAAFVADMEVGRFHGIGPATAARLAALGMRTGRDMARQSEAFMVERFGRSGAHYRHMGLGLDDRPVVPDRERKSYGSENTFDRDLARREDLAQELDGILARVWDDRVRIGRDGRTLTLKAKYRDFEQITRSKTASTFIATREQMAAMAATLLDSILPLDRPLRLIGLSVSNLGGVGEVSPETRQMALI